MHALERVRKIVDINYHHLTINSYTWCPACQNNQAFIELDCDYHNENSDMVYYTGQCSICSVPTTYLYKYSDVTNQYEYLPIETFKQPQSIPANEDLSDISPVGTATYQQALAAEEHGYHHLVGIGLRKALEFCIKDFACEFNPEDVDTIRRMPLKQVIEQYIDDQDLKDLSKGCAYIGNDETHYVRKFEDKDVQYMKQLIKFTFDSIHRKLRLREIRSTFPQ